MIHLYYGYGKGKTSSALGAGMRAYGAGMKVLMVQFLKDSGSSELESIPFEVFKSPLELPFNPGEDYLPWVENAINAIKESNEDMIILDEFMDVIPKFIDIKIIDSLFDENKEYIITGHDLVKELYDIADYVTCFKKEKHPYDKGIKARKGIEY